MSVALVLNQVLHRTLQSLPLWTGKNDPVLGRRAFSSVESAVEVLDPLLWVRNDD
jgi:hypothetical protein